jgi:hypothetical protein
MRQIKKNGGNIFWFHVANTMAADGSLSSAAFAECSSALGKDFFTECISVPSVLHSTNKLVTECGSRQRFLCRVPDKKHSAKLLALGKGPDSDRLSLSKISDIHRFRVKNMKRKYYTFLSTFFILNCCSSLGRRHKYEFSFFFLKKSTRCYMLACC